MSLNQNYLLDTNIISAVLKQNKSVIQKLARLVSDDLNIYISAISYFEIKRGLLAINAPKKLALFHEMCIEYEILGFEGEALLDRAAELHAYMRTTGQIIPENDIMIAATALTHNLILVTNDSHFVRIPHLITEDWLAR